MVRVKWKLQHADMGPPKCVVYWSHNAIKYIIQHHQELIQKDLAARDKKHKEDKYKKHVHTPPKEDSTTVMAT